MDVAINSSFPTEERLKDTFLYVSAASILNWTGWLSCPYFLSISCPCPCDMGGVLSASDSDWEVISSSSSSRRENTQVFADFSVFTGVRRSIFCLADPLPFCRSVCPHVGLQLTASLVLNHQIFVFVYGRCSSACPRRKAGVEVSLHSFLVPGDWLGSRSSRFNPRNRTPVPIGRRMVGEVLEDLKKREIFCPYRDSNTGSPSS